MLRRSVWLLLLFLSIAVIMVIWTLKFHVLEPVISERIMREEEMKRSFLQKESAEGPEITESVINQVLQTTESTTKSTILRDRVGVICYISSGISQIHLFLPLLYGSWKYINDHRDNLTRPEYLSFLQDVDLLAFCHPSICAHIHHACEPYSTDKHHSRSHPTCWAIEQPFESPVPYGPINSFIMFNRTDVHSIMKPYKYLIRTDYDVFLSPGLLTWKPTKRIVVGRGGYCDPFNQERLKQISKKLGMVHRGVHCVGSTWFGETDLFIELSKKTLEMTGYMWMNEFDPKATGLETIDFKKNREGEWIRWWRPVSLLYGGELAINHLIQDFSSKYKQELDTPSCSKDSIWTTPHIHCWHSDCEFQKFKFIKNLGNIVNSRENLPGEIVHRIIENIYEHDIRNMTISEYSTYIAWYSVAKHLQKWFF